MSNKRNKYIALLISLIMLFDFVPLSVFSEEAVVVDKSESQTVPVLLDPEDGTSDEEEFWEEVISEHIDDYTVTVTVTKEAEFPIGTTVTITPLSSGAYRNEAANLFDQNDNKLGSFIRVFDITFWYDDMEIEPLVPVDVKVTFDNAVELEGNNELKLIHLHEDEEAKEISAETETTQTEDSEVIESLSFQSDMFSTYIVAEEIVVYTFSESGNNYEVVLKVNSAMGLPQDAVFTVDEITKDSDLYDQYAAQVAAVINPDGAVRMPALLDISLKTADGEKIQLDNKVQVFVRLTDEDVKRGLQVVHFPGEDPFQGESAVRDAVANSSENDEIEVLDIESERLYPRLNTKENTVTFNTDSFSVFALAYTVEFTYEDLNGNLHIDFTGYDVLAAEEESAIVYDTAECDIHVSTEWLSSLLRQAAEPTEGITVETEINGNFRFNFASAEETEAIGGVRYADGGLAITADGSVCLTDGKRNLTVSITNLSVLKEEILEAEGVKIQVEEGNVPLGSEARYTIHSEEETVELVETFNLAEDQEEIVGFNAADLSIIRNEEEISAEGLFIVSLDKSTLVPVGMKLEKLYHVHDEETEELDVTETEDGLLEFTMSNFSDIVASYTVDFDYEGIRWSFNGFGRYAISEIMAQIGVEGEIESVDLLLMEGEEVEGALYLDQDEEDVWYLCSDVPFDEVYRLTVVVDGETYILTVTDEESWTVTINLYDYNGTSGATAEEISVLSGKSYGVIAVLEDTLGNVVGYNKTAVGATFSGSNNVATCSVGKQSFKSLQWNSSWWQEGDPVDPTGYTIKFRLYEDTCPADNWKDKQYGNIISLADSMTGFKFLPDPDGNVVTENAVTMKLQRAYDTRFNIRCNVEPAGLSVTDDDQYYAFVTVEHATTGTTYGWTKITIPRGQTTVDFPITEWYNWNGQLQTNEKFTGNETVMVQIYTTNQEPDGTKNGFDDFNTFKDNQTKVLVAEGSPMNMYNLYYGNVTDEDDDTNHIKNYYYNLILRAPDGSISKGDIDRLLDDATDFGYYTLRYIGHSGDIEATIGADYMDTVFEADFGYSSANVNVNRLKVLKIYTDNEGKPVQRPVEIRLKQNDKIVAVKTGTTDENGRLLLEFDGLNSGDYDIEEVINGKVISGHGHAEISSETIFYNFSIDKAHFANNKNVNYFGTIGVDQDLDKLKTMLQKASRVDVVILTDTQDDKARIVAAKEQQTTGKQIDVVLNGTSPYKHYDIKSDMVRLAQLSDDLANARSSSTVRIVNVKASEISENGFFFDDDGRYIVINIEMDQQAFCPMVTLGGQLLDCDYGQSGKSNSSHVLYNLRKNGSCYDGLFDTTKLGAGVILAPAANAHVLGGPFGGTIISAEVNRAGNELHSNNPNQIQTLNATIQNVIGQPTTGSLELRKEFSNTDIKDKITYFTFEVTLHNDDMTKVVNQAFPASGLKKGYYVAFDENGKAQVLVRAGNSATITNLPAGTTFTIEEITTPETQHFNLDHYEVNNVRTDKGTIVAGETAKAKVLNTVRKADLTIEKQVLGTTDDSAEFEFVLALENNAGNSANEAEWYPYPDTYKISVAGSELTEINGSVTPSYTFRLKAGQKAEIQDLVVDNAVIRYTVTETAVYIDGNRYEISSDNQPVKGYSNSELVKQANYTQGDRVVFENRYSAETKVRIVAHKVLQGRTLKENEFTFELREERPTGPVIGTAKQNMVDGTVTFDDIEYKIEYRAGQTTNDSMADATQKPDGTREKVFTYYICEAQDASVTDIAYAEPVEVRIKVVDDGIGHLYAYDEEWNPITVYSEGILTDYTYTLPSSKDVVNSVMIEKTLEGTKTMTGREMDEGETFEFIVKENDVEVSRGIAVKGTGSTVNISFQPIVYSYNSAETYPVTHEYTITEDNTKLLEDVTPNTQVFYAKVTVDYNSETKVMAATNPKYSTDRNTWVESTNIAFTNTGETIGFEVTKDWRNLEDAEILDTSASVLLRISRKDGKPFMLKDSQWENKNGKGTVTSVEPVLDLVTQALVSAGLMDQPARENLIKLTPGTDGWPVVAFKNLPKATYVVEEVNCKLDDSGSTTADVETTYVLDSGAGTSAAPDITANGSSLVIRNNETTDNLKVTKNFVLPDGFSANDIAKKDPIYFAVRLNHSEDGSWNSYYNNSHAAEVNSVPLYTINWDETNQTWTTVTIGTIPAKYEGRPVLSYSILEMTAEGWPKTTDAASLLGVKYYKNYGKAGETEVATVEQGQGGLVTIENTIPVPRHLRVTKKWVDENDDELTDLTGRNTISFILVHKDAYGNLSYAVRADQDNSISFSDDIAGATTFTLHGHMESGHQVWDEEVFDDLQLTPNVNDANNYSTYYVVETVGNGPEVTCIIDNGTVNGTLVDSDHPYDPNTSGKITIVNKEADKSIKVQKVWIGPNPPESIDVVLQHIWEGGVNAGWGWQTDDRQKLSDDNGWSYTWDSITETDSYGTRIYRVVEYTHDDSNPGNQNAVPEYDVEYSSNNENLHCGDVVTITNTKQTTGIAVKKLWDVEDENDIQPVTVELRKAGEIRENNAVKVRIYSYIIDWDGTEKKGKAFEEYVKYGSSLTAHLQAMDEIRVDSGNGGYSTIDIEGDTCTVTGIITDLTIGIKSDWNTATPTVNYISGMIPDYTNYSVAGKVTLSEDGTTLVDGATAGGSNWYYEWSSLDEGYYFVEELNTGYTVTYSENNSGIKTGTITITNSKTTPQTGSVQVTKNFVFPAESELTVPTDFQITATWGSPAQTVTLKVNENGYTGTLPTDITVSKTDNGNNSYTWTIDNLPLDTVVTFAESGYDIPGYVVSAEISPTNGQAAAATTPGEVAITNTYTPGVELPATGGPGTALYTFLGLMLILLAGGLLVFNRRRVFDKNR